MSEIWRRPSFTCVAFLFSRAQAALVPYRRALGWTFFVNVVGHSAPTCLARVLTPPGLLERLVPATVHAALRLIVNAIALSFAVIRCPLEWSGRHCTQTVTSNPGRYPSPPSAAEAAVPSLTWPPTSSLADW